MSAAIPWRRGCSNQIPGYTNSLIDLGDMIHQIRRRTGTWTVAHISQEINLHINLPPVRILRTILQVTVIDLTLAHRDRATCTPTHVPPTPTVLTTTMNLGGNPILPKVQPLWYTEGNGGTTKTTIVRALSPVLPLGNTLALRLRHPVRAPNHYLAMGASKVARGELLRRMPMPSSRLSFSLTQINLLLTAGKLLTSLYTSTNCRPRLLCTNRLRKHLENSLRTKCTRYILSGARNL